LKILPDRRRNCNLPCTTEGTKRTKAGERGQKLVFSFVPSVPFVVKFLPATQVALFGGS